MTQAKRTAGGWLPLGEPSTAHLRLFCFPHAGGGAASFAGWRRLAGARLTVCPVQPPGRAERFGQPPHRTVTSCVDALVAELGHQFTGRYALFGHSVGALVAYRLACRLVRAGAPPPAHLFVSGRVAPHLPNTRIRLADLPTTELLGHLRALGGMPTVFLDDPALVEVFLPLLRADFAVNESYRHVPADPVPVPITAFGGDQDPRADRTELRAWHQLTSAPFALRTYPGGHFYLDQHAGDVLDVVGGALDADRPTPAHAKVDSGETERRFT